ncbi:GNAT family N-acetyltransferase [Gluconacetobacter entanii]|uniref:GNAT family N-acetyltransferase n=2 Tax=Gluconacetobacter entanii TaxID=108528 RepID=A0A318PQG4_9PROT|nr:GNAT family N-acetyltransferase [Gluconacetobacter entanii]
MRDATMTRMTMTIEIREASVSDSRSVLEMKRKLDGQTRFMMFEPDERSMDVAAMQSEIAQLRAADNSVLLLAFAQGTDVPVGYVEVTGGSFRRNRHVGSLVIGICATHTGMGIGTALLGACADWARAHGIGRLELTVMVHNDRAIRLYEKSGFVVEGRRIAALMVDGAAVDEYVMGRIL